MLVVISILYIHTMRDAMLFNPSALVSVKILYRKTKYSYPKQMPKYEESLKGGERCKSTGYVWYRYTR